MRLDRELAQQNNNQDVIELQDDDYVEFTIGVDAAKDPENDSDYNITIIVDFATLNPEASFNVVW